MIAGFFILEIIHHEEIHRFIINRICCLEL
jgi:hypothetical protein